MVDKLIISNNNALTRKYGQSGLQSVQAAITQLLAADRGRGLESIYAALDDPMDMNATGAAVVANPDNPQENKIAVDALYQYHRPQYVVLLGSVDVIPHQDLANPAYDPDPINGDPDQTVPSDLPYACNAPYSQKIADFVGPTRVLSRIPDLTRASEPSYLLHVLDLAAAAAVLTHADYQDYLGVTASVWSQSTGLSLGAVFGSSGDLQSVPPAAYQWPANVLLRRSHFINCHGAQLSSQYYGQLGTSYPVAHDAAFIAGKLTRGTLAAVECCYGAELYDPAQVGGQMGIANTYLDGGSYGFWGSTTIAYGPAASNGDADLICQYFLEEALNGASIGRAALAARQKFIRNNAAMSPINLKTLGQFILLGDASIQCVPSADAGLESAPKFALLGLSRAASHRQSRLERRQELAQLGAILGATKAVAETSLSNAGGDVQKMLDQIGTAAGFKRPLYRSYQVEQKAAPKFFALEAAVPRPQMPTAFHLLFERMPLLESRINALRILEVTEADGKIVKVRDLVSR